MHDDVNTELKFNPSALATLTRLAISSRTVKAFCEDSGLSRSLIFRILGYKLDSAPTKRSLRKLAVASEGRVTVNQLFVTCGYAEESNIPVTIPLEKPAPEAAMQPNATVILSDDIAEMLTQLKEISAIASTTHPIVVLAKKLDTLILLRQFFQSNNDINIRYALIVE